MSRKTLLLSERNFFQRIDFPRIKVYIAPMIFLLVAGILIVLAQWAVLNRRGDSFKVGSPAPETYRVITRMRYDDQESARVLREMVSSSVESVTVRDMSAKARLLRRLEAMRDLKDLQSARNLAYLSPFPDGLIIAFIRLNDADKSRIVSAAYTAGSAYLDRLGSENMFATRTNTQKTNAILWEEIRKSGVSTEDSNFIYQILAGLGNLNFRTDSNLTELARQAVVNDVPAIDRKLEPGDVIISQGETVTEQTASLLRLQGYTEDVFPIKEIITVIICVMILPLWLDIFRRGAGEHQPTKWCVVFVVATAWGFETVAAKIGIYGAGTLAAINVSFLCIDDYLAFCTAMIAGVSGVFVITGQAVTNIILLAVMVGCGSSPDSPALTGTPSQRGTASRPLEGIDSLMWRQPDSALTVMLEFAGSAEADSLDEFNGHYCQVLVAELLYKNYKKQSNRDDVLRAVDYFDSIVVADGYKTDGRKVDTRGASLRERNVFLDARAHYINGAGFYENGDVVRACEEYLNALEIMEEHFGDKVQKGKNAVLMFYTYNRLLELFSAQFMMEPALSCGEKALSYCQNEPSLSKEIPNAYYHIGRQYDKMGEKDIARRYYGQAIEGLSDINNLVYRDVVSTKALCDYQVGLEADASITTIKKMLDYANSEKETLTRLLTIGGIFTVEQSFDSAIYYLEPVFENKDDVSLQICAAEYLLIDYDHLGDKAKSDECMRFLDFDLKA